MIRARALVWGPVVVGLLVLASCRGAADPVANPTLLQDPRRPYVIPAVDNHFHDAHPSEPIALDRVVVFKNEGRNLHNVTIAETNISRDLRPGEEFEVDPIASLLDGPGTYRLICKYHADLGMTGDLVVVDAP